MNNLLSYFASEDWTRLAFVLLHSIWQGIIVSLMLWYGLRRLPASKPEARYAAALLALAAVVLGACVTGAVLDQRVTLHLHSTHFQANGGLVALTQTGASVPVDATEQEQRLSSASLAASAAARVTLPASQALAAPVWMSWVILFWLAGCAVLSLRLLMQWLDLGRLAGRCQQVVEEPIHEIVQRLQQVLGMNRRIRVLTGEHIKGPSIYGLLAPTMLLPPALLLGVPRGQLEAIIAHELGHIRRHDYLVNLLQQWVETVLFFNPAIWWINRQIRIEREACCDRLAVEITGNAQAYAWSLAHWAERQAGYALAPTFGSERHAGGPLERLKRLLVSEYRPRVRLPWYSFMGMLILTLLLFTGVFQGTYLAVGWAAQILSPAERLQKMADLQEKYGQKNPVNGDHESSAENQAVISGHVHAQPELMETVDLFIHSQARFYGASYSQRPTKPEGRFEVTVRAGKIYLAASGRGYAPLLAGPFEVQPGGRLDGLDLTLSNGFSAQIKLVDPQGAGIANAEIEYVYQHPTSGFEREPQKSAADGVVRLDHLIRHPMKFRVTAAGFEYDELKTTLQSGQQQVWSLQPARITRGRVVARQTGQPVPGARIVLCAREGLYPMQWGRFEHAPQMAVADEEGRFELRSLNSRMVYTLAAIASGFAPKTIPNVTAGSEIKTELDPQIDLTGRIVGDLAVLGRVVPKVNLTQSMRTGTSEHCWSVDSAVVIRENTGFFAFTNLAPGRVTISVGPWTQTTNLTQSIHDWVVDLKAISQAKENLALANRREVRLQVQVPKDQPLPSGNLGYSYWSDIDHRGHPASVPLTNGMASVQVPVPGGLILNSEAIAGYWIELLHQAIGPGPGPAEVIIPAIPAGSIYGEVLESDGSAASDVMISVLEVHKAPLKKNRYGSLPEPKNSSSEDDGPTQFTAQPLPLGGTYMILARRRNTYVASAAIPVTEEHSIQKTTLTIPAGIELKGQVISEAGQPLARVPVALELQSKYSHTFGAQPVMSDSTGWFKFERVNPEVPGTYHLSVRRMPGFQPLSQTVRFGSSTPVLKLAPGFSVTGVVIDRTTDKPVPSAKVYAYLLENDRFAGFNWDAETGPDGRFMLDGLGSRTYQIVVQGCEMGKTTFRGGETTHLTLRVQPNAQN